MKDLKLSVVNRKESDQFTNKIPITNEGRG